MYDAEVPFIGCLRMLTPRHSNPIYPKVVSRNQNQSIGYAAVRRNLHNNREETFGKVIVRRLLLLAVNLLPAGRILVQRTHIYFFLKHCIQQRFLAKLQPH
jgi:hypothetical protein